MPLKSVFALFITSCYITKLWSYDGRLGMKTVQEVEQQQEALPSKLLPHKHSSYIKANPSSAACKEFIQQQGVPAGKDLYVAVHNVVGKKGETLVLTPVNIDVILEAANAGFLTVHDSDAAAGAYYCTLAPADGMKGGSFWSIFKNLNYEKIFHVAVFVRDVIDYLVEINDQLEPYDECDALQREARALKREAEHLRQIIEHYRQDHGDGASIDPFVSRLQELDNKVVEIRDRMKHAAASSLSKLAHDEMRYYGRFDAAPYDKDKDNCAIF